MCIRDRVATGAEMAAFAGDHHRAHFRVRLRDIQRLDAGSICLLYTSDAADERSSVDLGGRRIIKKKKNNNAQQKTVG